MENCKAKWAGKPEANCDVLHPDHDDHVAQSLPREVERKAIGDY